MKKHISLAVVILMAPLANADVMNLNNFMPNRLTDARPTPNGKINLLGTVRHENDKLNQTLVRPNIRYGLPHDEI